MRSQGKLQLLRIAALLGGMALSGHASAQDSAPSPTAQRGAEPVVQEIIVTAQRRRERLEDVPLSITALNAETLAKSGVQRIQDLGQITTGAQVNRAGGFTQPAVRGVSTLTTGIGFENNVAVYVDGFYQSDTVAINGDLVNLASVQVLKGPQGTLYGRNATGGAIVIDTLPPSDKLTANAQLAYGRFDDRRAQGYISGPIADDVGFSIAASYRESDGYIRDLGADPATSKDNFDAAPIRNNSVRTKLQWEPSDSATIMLSYNHGRVLDARGLVYTINRYPFAIPAPPARATERDTATNNNRANNAASLDEYTAKLQFDTAIGTLTSYTGYAQRDTEIEFDFDGSNAPVTYASTKDITQETVQQSIDYAIDAFERVDLVVGGLYYDDRLRNYNQSVFSGGSLLRYQFARLSSAAAAVYVDSTFHVTDRLFLTAGARYSDERREIRYFERPGTQTTLVPPADKHASFTSVTPRAVLRYQLSDRTNVYASYTEGFRSGVFNPSVQPSPDLVVPVDPEKIDAYEVGFKTAGSSLRLDAAAYYYDYRDLQVGLTIPNPLAPTNVIQTIINAQQAQIYGAETQVTYSPLNSLNIRAGVAYIHARYKDFKTATGTGLNPTTQRNVSAQPQDWSGQEMARAPEWSANLGFDYTFNMAGGELVLAANGSYTASYVVSNPSLYGPLMGDLAGVQRYRQGSFTIVNAQLNWTDPSGRYTVGVYGDNLSDTRYQIVNSGGAFGDYTQYNEPLNYGGRIGFKF